MILQKLCPCVIIIIAFVTQYQEIQGFISLQASQRSRFTAHYLSKVRGLSSYEEYQVNGLIEKTLRIFDGTPTPVDGSTPNGFDVTNELISTILRAVQSFTQNVDRLYLSSSQSVSQYFSQCQKTLADFQLDNIHLDTLFHDPSLESSTSEILLIAATILSISILMQMKTSVDVGPTSPYPEGRYDASSAKKYFDQRKWVLFTRFTEIAFATSVFLFKVLYDFLR